MEVILVLLAILGGAALVYRLVRSLLVVAIAAAEATAASGMAEISARRGDLSLLAERQQAQAGARRAGLRSGLQALLWLLLLVAPLYLAWTLEAYALASMIWLLPHQPIRRSVMGPPG